VHVKIRGLSKLIKRGKRKLGGRGRGGGAGKTEESKTVMQEAVL